MTNVARAVQVLALMRIASVEPAYSQSMVPPNDHFADAFVLSGTDLVTAGSNLNATTEPGEPNPAGSAGGHSVWWTWTAPREGTLFLSTAGSGFDTLLGVFSGNSVSNLALLAFNNNDPAGGVLSSRVTLNVVTGTQYHITVDGHLDSAGTITLALLLGPTQPPPPNDNFANRIALSGRRVNTGGSNEHASREPGEPKNAGVLGGNSVWWSWTAPQAGRLSVSTTGSRLDTLLGVYRGDAVSSLVFVAGNDDVPNSQGSQGIESAVALNVVGGETYQISVDGYDNVAGDLKLSLVLDNPEPVPLNDNFTNRIVLTGTEVTVTGSNTGASFEPGEPAHASGFGGKSVWWAWTAPGTGVVTIDTIGTSFDTLLGIYEGPTLLQLTEVASDDDGGGNGTSATTFGAKAGTTYVLAVDGWDSATGSITLHVAFYPGPKLFAFGQSAAQIQTNGFVLHMVAPAGFSYVIETSATLREWIPFQTNQMSVNGIVTIRDLNAGAAAQRFYRVLRLP